MLGDAHAQDATETALQRLGHFRQMREREPDFFAAGDHDAVGVEQPKAASVTFCVATRSGIMRAPIAM